MKDVLLITNYFHFEWEKESSRYLTLSEMINERDCSLELITSNFYHQTKEHRQKSNELMNKIDYKVTLINEPGYEKNISLKRILSHKEFSKNVLSYLSKRKLPDVIYCVVPTLDLAYSVGKFSKENNIKFIVDIQDLWPDAFNIAIKSKLITKVLTYPMKKKAEKVYKFANNIVAVSETYKEIGMKFQKKPAAKSAVAYLGVDLEKVDKILEKVTKKTLNEKDYIDLVYAGSLGHSYDLINVFKALQFLKVKCPDLKVKFTVMGQGPLENKFKEFVKLNNLNVIFTGKLKYPKVITILKKSDIAINSIVKESVASIINKHADYSAAGLPVINTQDSSEYKNLINQYSFGINCPPSDYIKLANAIEKLSTNKEMRLEMGKNSRKVAEEKFDRKKTYVKIVDLIQY